MRLSLESCLNILTDAQQPLSKTELMSLSGLTSEELAELKAVWPDIDANRRTEMLERLREMSDDNLDADFDDLFRFCLDDEDPEVKTRAIEGLWECEDRSLVSRLSRLLSQDPSAKVRATAAMGLGKFASLAQTGRLPAKDWGRIKDPLIGTIRDKTEDSEVRRRAIEAVAPFNTPEIREIIWEAYKAGQAEMKYSAVYAMGKSCDPEWLPVVVQELTSPDTAMRYEAACACGELGEEPAVPHLIPLFQDEDPQTQASAITAVGAIGGGLAKKALLRCLKSSDDLVVESAQAALETLEAIDDSGGFG